MSTTVILVPTNQMDQLLAVKHIDLQIIPSMRTAGLTDFLHPDDRAVSIGVTGVPADAKYETTVDDLISPDALEFFCKEIAKMLMAISPAYCYFPESGLASVSMKHPVRLTQAIQAKVNARVTELLDLHGHLDGIHLSLNNNTSTLPLVRFSSLHL